MGGFEDGLGFDDAAGDMFESACITVIIKLGLLGPAHLITCLCILKIWGIAFPLIGIVFGPLESVCIVLVYFITSIVSSCLGLLFPSCLLLTSHLFLRILKHSTYLILLFSPFSTHPPFLSVSCYHVHVDHHVTGGCHDCLRLCFIGEHVCG